MKALRYLVGLAAWAIQQAVRAATGACSRCGCLERIGVHDSEDSVVRCAECGTERVP